jgi:signal transduction histidine kinase
MPVQPHNPRVLIVDDDKQNLVSLSAALSHLNVEIKTSTKAREAIYLINSHSFALLIFDVQMPEMDGYQLAEIIQSGYRNAKTPIIFISGVFYDEFSIFKGYRKGAVDYLTKPINIEIFQSKVRVFLELNLVHQEIEIERSKTIEALNEKNLAMGVISHEIRNPLGVIINVINLLEDNNMDEDSKIYFKILSSASKHMSNLLNDLVDFSKIESGLVLLENTTFNLHDEVQLLLQSFHINQIIDNNTFSLEFDQQIPQIIRGDITRYKQILYNLLGNANKFTSNGQITIKISQTQRIDNKVSLLTQITDNGIGMTEDELKDIFKPFSQSNQTITRKYGGSGLGLTISKQLAELLGGKLMVESQKGIGSTFSFENPFDV